jgi:thiamine-monophosphate kinase
MTEPPPLPAEFTLIARHFKPLAGSAGLGLTDDAAVLTPPPGRDLVLTADAMVAGVHFLPDDRPSDIARKLLRTNLSDLAAMGAAPLGYLLTVSVPRGTQDEWFAGFAAGLAMDQAEFAIALLGGDTTSTPGPVSLSLTAVGTVAPSEAIRRNGARPGDGLWVTGAIGDGALGLLAAQNKLADPTGWLASRYRLPMPRLNVARYGLVSAAMDVSDGLVQDVSHVCRASGCAAEIIAQQVPRSAAALAAGDEFLPLCLTGGDDYELALAVPPTTEAEFAAHAAALGVAVTRIGRFVAGVPTVSVVGADGCEMPLSRGGWSHFA